MAGIYNYNYPIEVKSIDDIFDKNLTFPYSKYAYDNEGNITSVSLSIGANRSYEFSPEGVLESRWDGLIMYDLNGKIIMTRKSGR